jgi:hypothetical protein
MTKKPRGRKARALLLAAAGAATIVIAGCGEMTGTSGNLLPPDYDMYPPPDQSAVADMAQPVDLAKKD